MWLDRYPNPADAAQPKVTLNIYYHARAGDRVAPPDPHETSEVGWFEPDALPPEIAFPHHAEAVLAAWRDAVRDGQTVMPLPDRP
jgi:hypothetical protein